MDRNFVEFVISDIKESKIQIEELRDIDLFSKDFFFDQKYAKYRSQVVILGGLTEHKSILSFLIREGMTSEYREKIFSGVYDLGNMRTIPIEKCTYELLANELFVDEKDAPEANDAFETIQKSVYQITGRKIHEYSKINKSTTLKVVKTLSVLLRERQQSLMQLFNPPSPQKKFSLSFRDAYPYEKNQEQVWLIADIKSYLSAEIGQKRIEEICKIFYSLHDLINEIVVDIETILIDAYSNKYNSMIAAYREMIEVVRNFPVHHKPVDLPLDEELFIQLNKLEFVHFVVGHDQLVSEANPNCQIKEVFSELSALTKKAFPYVKDVKEHHPLLSISQVPKFILDWHAEITEIIKKAINVNLALSEIKRINADVQNLLRNYYFFRFESASVLQDQELVSPWRVVAAMCCVVYTHNTSSNFKAYWLGQRAQGGSVKASNKESFLEIKGTIDTIPEEHRHIWMCRLDWIADALRGQHVLRKEQFALRSAVGLKLLDICQTNNIDWISQQLINFKISNIEHAIQKHSVGAL